MHKLFIHPEARLCSQETDFPHLRKYVPFTRDKLGDYFTLVESIDGCDFIFVGQVNEGYTTPKDIVDICIKNPSKVIVDLEGDFGHTLFHDCFKSVITCVGAPDRAWELTNSFVRPPMSNTFLSLHEHSYEYIPPNKKKLNFVFQGQANLSNRIMLLNELASLPIRNTYIKVMRSWGGNVDIGGSDYAKNLNENLISLCPKGVGGNSIRFYESCLLGCAPVVVGNDLIMAENYYDTSFIFQLRDYNNPTEIKSFLQKIHNIPKEEMIRRGECARKYYEDIISPYLDDPLLEFTKWLK